jgi:hypothetical protein
MRPACADRGCQPEEKWYALTGRVVDAKVEADGDIHLVLQDAANTVSRPNLWPGRSVVIALLLPNASQCSRCRQPHERMSPCRSLVPSTLTSLPQSHTQIHQPKRSVFPGVNTVSRPNLSPVIACWYLLNTFAILLAGTPARAGHGSERSTPFGTTYTKSFC